MIGETVGSYKLVAKLGEGGMGEVYLAEHKYIPRRAAVKFLLPELSGSADVVNRFFSEARAASVIDHPSIVEVLDCEVHNDGRAFIVMELLSGEDLRAYLRRNGKIDDDPIGALGICRQIASALAAAHAQGIVHRDLKPDNVFLHLPVGRDAHQPIVKLLDFGIAKLMGGGPTGSKTRSGQLLGTPIYMSPEQCRGGREIDGRSDIYSLGCIMFEMFCGRPPFIDDGYGDLIIAHASLPPPDPVQFAPALLPEIRQTLLACLEKAPEHRPDSMQALADRLREMGGHDLVRLQKPVVYGAGAPDAISTPGARSPVGWASTPARVATTPFSVGGGIEAPRPARRPSSGAGLQPIGGTQVLPTPALAHAPALTTLSGRAAEVMAPRPRRAPIKTLVAAALVAGGVAAFVALRTPERTPRTADALEPAASSARQPESRAVTPSSLPEEARPSPPASIQLTGLPSGATVRLDGRPAAVPVTVPRGSQMHHLTVEAEGYEAWERSVDGAADQSFALKMIRKPSAGAANSKPKHRNGHSHAAPGFVGFSDL